MNFTCDICSVLKGAHDFYRTDGSYLRCKSCCLVTRFCNQCKIPKCHSHFKGKSKICFDCRNGVFKQPVVNKKQHFDYVLSELENHAKWLSGVGIKQNGIHL